MLAFMAGMVELNAFALTSYIPRIRKMFMDTAEAGLGAANLSEKRCGVKCLGCVGENEMGSLKEFK